MPPFLHHPPPAGTSSTGHSGQSKRAEAMSGLAAHSKGNMAHKKEMQIGGKTLSVETGAVARQANGACVVRLMLGGQAGSRHELAEFTREDIAQMVAAGPRLRHPVDAPAAGSTTSA